jgi:hypothetical protein
VDQIIEEDLLNHLKKLRSYTPFHPPPKEDGPKKVKLSGKQAIKKYPDMILIPTRYLGVSICLKGEL